ncbi:hypothetical protein BDA99DRAFT_342645 [Phascolomyces articulosus]|uniref:Secreted protein n=1 Tax=Phascolomyces articulosus TaxID=60185 RepID=A0AAD5KK25_9FUNG|nr:hypothetical protein BDA99DRAFT_342645 [Phascolomyces articulosus]
MKASYIVALFALVAVATAQDTIKDSKVQSQSADGTLGQVTDNSHSVVAANDAVKEGVNVLSSKEITGTVEQGQTMH